MRTQFRVGNRKAFGVVCKPETNSRMAGHIHRAIHLEKPNTAKTGSILTDKNNNAYILISDRAIPGHDIFIGLVVNAQLQISDMVELKNDITKRTHKVLSPVRTSIPACRELTTVVSDKGFEVPVTRYYIAGEISPEAVVNNKNIKNVQYVLGISNFEVV